MGLKVLHPDIAADPAMLDLLENELEIIRKANHPQLVGYFSLERSTPCLVRDRIHGFLLYDLLRWRRSLNAAELQALLGPLAATLDFVSERGLGLVDVSIRKIFVEWPKELRAEEFPNLARANAEAWKDCSLKVNPLSLAPLLFRSRNAWDRQTIVPTSRVLSITQTELVDRALWSRATTLRQSLAVTGAAPISMLASCSKMVREAKRLTTFVSKMGDTVLLWKEPVPDRNWKGMSVGEINGAGSRSLDRAEVKLNRTAAKIMPGPELLSRIRELIPKC